MSQEQETEKVDGPIPGTIVDRNFVDSTTFQLTIKRDGETYKENYTYEETLRVKDDEGPEP